MEAQQSGMADLAARLTKRLGDANANRNLVFSPLSIYAVLALQAAGAGGDTLDEILRVLGARSRKEVEDSVARLLDGPLRDTSESGGPSVAFAYGVWSDQTMPMKSAYRDAVVGTYKAEASVVDFLHDPHHAAGQINAWVAEATRNLITSAVPPGSLHPDTRLVLANAVYFSGKWDLPFCASDTENRPFYRLDGTAVDVPFMTNSDRHYIGQHDGFKVLQLLYKSSPNTSSHHSMCIFLPDERDGLGNLMNKITSSPGFLRQHLPQSTTVGVGQFRVPKFELNSCSSVTTVLKDLGLRLPFGPKANLSQMLEDDGSNLPFHLQEVFHKAVIEVNEEGTRAAAVTMAFFPKKKCGRRVNFVADHPFAYFIIEEGSGAVIFAGHVVDPSNGSGAVIPPFPLDEATDDVNCRSNNTKVADGNHPDLVSLPPLPEGGEVEERAIVTDDNQEAPSFVNEPVDSRKSAGSSEGTASAQSPPPAISPKGKRKSNDVEDSGTSKAEEVDPLHQKATYDPYLASLVSSDDEEEVPTHDVAPRTSASHTVLVSETLVEGEESSPPQQNVVTTTPPSSPLAPSPKRTRVETIIEPAPQLGSSSHSLLHDPMIKELIRIGSQFIGYREYASRTEEKLAEANRLADTLAQKLEQSETARKKAEFDASQAKVEADKAKAKAASVEELQKKLDDAETALNEHKAAQDTHEKGILKRLKTQNRRFLS
ncbi:hypothetical protein QYE76_001659 [Lolium multiflorum]|uniref:Serpin domain-containing protein n=1 Tax=Lolium multiflorum TaxID=4521 RepID=A0AAD8RLL0_LOLMU|nr:hypothetical protein QYE76_001659 [Lolium multiflorum]